MSIDTLPLNSLRRGMSQDVMPSGAMQGGGSASLAASLGTRFSVASHMSVSSYFTEDYGRLEVMDDDELKQLVDDLKESNHIMELENEVMVRYLIRNADYDEMTLRQVIDRVAERAWRVIRMGPNQAQPRPSNSSSNIALATGHSSSRATLDSTGDRRVNASVTSTHMRSKDNSIAKLASPTLMSSRRLSGSPSIMSATAGGGVGINFERQGQRLNLAGKLEMLSRELADGKRELDRLEAYFAHRSVILRVRIETATTMTEELDREREAFERDVVIGGVDPMTGRVPAERFVRHVVEWIRSMAQLGEKLRLRTSTLFSQLRRVQTQLAAKAELGETLTPVDFEQLHIDNKRFLATIEQKNLQVIELKRMAGDCALQLSVHKKALLADRAIEEFLRTIGDERQRQCDFMDEERAAVEDQIERLQNRLDSLNTLTSNFTAPSVLDYARLRAKVAEQYHQLRIWKRRVDLQESALLVATSNMRSAKAANRRSLLRMTEDQKDETKRLCQFWLGTEEGLEEEGEGADEGKDLEDSEDSWLDMPDHFTPLPALGTQPCDDYLQALEQITRKAREDQVERFGAPGGGPAATWHPAHLPPLMEVPGEDYSRGEEEGAYGHHFTYRDLYYRNRIQQDQISQDLYYDQSQTGEWADEESSSLVRQDEMEQPSTDLAADEGESQEPQEGEDEGTAKATETAGTEDEEKEGEKEEEGEGEAGVGEGLPEEGAEEDEGKAGGAEGVPEEEEGGEEVGAGKEAGGAEVAPKAEGAGPEVKQPPGDDQ